MASLLLSIVLSDAGASQTCLCNELGKDKDTWRLNLFAKDTARWQVIEGGAKGELTIHRPSGRFEIKAEGLRPNTEYALALQSAYRERLSDMGDADGRRALGAEAQAPACTTHFSAVDRDGNMAAVTQTLLSSFGSKFVSGQTGITMNNGIMWFDPTPGVPNSLAPGKRCLTNYTPVLAQASDGRRAAIGASGGRRILPAVSQLLSFVMDYGMDLDAVIHQPRIDASEGAVVIGDVRLPQAAREALGAQFDYEEARIQTLPMKFACPSIVLRDGDTNSGATEVFQPWSEAVAEG
jgi:gamma-glutamyltranspeptidase/glutathione hydrolase